LYHLIKIASLVPYKIIPPITGGEKGIYYFQKHLSNHSELTVITVLENNNDETGYLKFSPVIGSTHNKFRYINPLLFFKIRKICTQQSIRHIIIEHPYYGWLGYLLKKIAGLKVILHSHNIEGQRFKTMGKWWWNILYQYEKFTYRSANLVLFITEEDRQFALQNFHVKASKCMVATYGIETAETPTEDKKIAREQICKEAEINPDETIILYNGVLNYQPNLSALDKILNYINPLLKQKATKPYKIIICGKGLPDQYKSLTDYKNSNIVYKGFVPDIQPYFLGADVFINPITDGGGIKTKLVEALAANTPCVSFHSGAYGVPATITGNHHSILPDDDYEAFAKAVLSMAHAPEENIPTAFYEHFNWDKITDRVARAVEELS
jgi:polysaccharide biosynthesis protein PslH